jgi:branched-chain amino acid aminotransferase
MKRLWLGKGLVTDLKGLSAADRGLTLGDGLFETIAVTNAVPLWRYEHLQRLQKAATELGIGYPDDHIEDAVDALTHGLKGHHVLRLTLTRGEGGRGLAETLKKPTVMGTVRPFDIALRFKPTTLITSTIRRNAHSPSAGMKTLSYIDNVMAARDAAAAGADDALMLNTSGRLACTTIGNIFLERDGVLYTPSLSEGVLPGIMREAILKLLPVKEKQLRTQDIAQADAMFMTNSLRFIRPITKLDGKRFTKKSKLIDKLMRALVNAEQEQLALE